MLNMDILLKETKVTTALADLLEAANSELELLQKEWTLTAKATEGLTKTTEMTETVETGMIAISEIVITKTTESLEVRMISNKTRMIKKTRTTN